MSAPQKDPSPLAAPTRRSTARSNRRRNLARTIVAVLAIIGVWHVVATITGKPRVGYFQSVAGRNAYAAAYRDAMTLMPPLTKQHDIQTDYSTVRVYEWSTPATADTTPIVLLPGRSSGVPMWAANLPSFAETHRVVAFDALGDAGMSTQSVPLISMADQAEWIDQVMDAVAPMGAHFVGHSFSGATATAYAYTHPERVVSLALLEPVFTFAYPPASMMAWVLVASIPGVPDSIRNQALNRIGGVEDDHDDDDALARMIALGTKHYRAQLPTPSLLTAYTAAALSMPVYVAIASDSSLAGGQKAADKAHQLLDDVTVHTWPNTTHSLPMQVPHELATHLQKLWDSAK